MLHVKMQACCDSLSNLYLWHIKYSEEATKALKDLVVIRFQICIFDILNTAIQIDCYLFDCCDSLSNLYLWHIKYSSAGAVLNVERVVIRFQICIFDILNTAMYNPCRITRGCDSLSNLYLWHIKYSRSTHDLSGVVVVIRFQICIFDILNTAV